MSENTNIKELNTFKVSEIVETVESKKLIIFDMDGTIFNSEKLHFIATNKLLNGFKFKEDDIYGIADIDIYNLAKKHFKGTFDEFLNQKNICMIEMLKEFDKEYLMFKDYALLFEELKRQDKSLALVTASEFEVAHAMLNYCEIHHYFSQIITTREVKQTKPHPEPYLLALSNASIDSKNAVVFEDSQTGIASANAAGIDTIKVNWYENN